MRLELSLHPDGRCEAVTRIEVEVARAGPGTLALRYIVTGTIADLRLAPQNAPTRADGLWRRTCFEAFIGAAPAYYEVNLSPSTQWAAYRFDAYRAGMENAEISPPAIAIGSNAACFELRAEVALPADGVSPIGLAAVIEERNGRISHWALAHPPGAPDFHHPDCFAAELPAARPA